jgi:hypothetical protein
MAPVGVRSHDSCLPSAVLDGWLFLGSYDTAARQELLKVFGITHILNVRDRRWRVAACSYTQQLASPQPTPSCLMPIHAHVLPQLMLTCEPGHAADGPNVPGAVSKHVYLPHCAAGAPRL